MDLVPYWEPHNGGGDGKENSKEGEPQKIMGENSDTLFAQILRVIHGGSDEDVQQSQKYKVGHQGNLTLLTTR